MEPDQHFQEPGSELLKGTRALAAQQPIMNDRFKATIANKSLIRPVKKLIITIYGREYDYRKHHATKICTNTREKISKYCKSESKRGSCY